MRLNEQSEKFVSEITESLLKSLDSKLADYPSNNKYSKVNIAFNVIICALANLSNHYINDMEEKKNFAISVSDLLIRNYEYMNK